MYSIYIGCLGLWFNMFNVVPYVYLRSCACHDSFNHVTIMNAYKSGKKDYKLTSSCVYDIISIRHKYISICGTLIFL